MGNSKTYNFIHWASTGLLSLFLLLSAGMYIATRDDVEIVFSDLGFPSWLIYPMAIAKIAGVILLLSKFSESLTEWAYAGIFFNLLLAVGAHVAVNDGQFIPAFVGIVLLMASYFTWKRRSISKIKISL